MLERAGVEDHAEPVDEVGGELLVQVVEPRRTLVVRRVDGDELLKVNDSPGNTLSVSPVQFEHQLAFLAANYNIVSPAQVLGAVEGTARLPDAALLVTFDDGYLDNYCNAYPILVRLGIPALLFLATDFVGTRRRLPHDEGLSADNPTLGWHHLEQMRDIFTIGSHGRSHRILTRIPRGEAIHEIESSKTIIEDRIGRVVDFFSYPNGSTGDYSDELEDRVSACGYRASFLTLLGFNSAARVRSGMGLRRYNAEPLASFVYARLIDGSCDLVGLKDTALGVRCKVVLNSALGTPNPL
ncbi:MAG: polysaccharide deacetylase family protein [Actinobacteria bacterium]|nr:polysaccharide deacetylase family protein [Actinomycetota bacterium]